MSNDDNNDNAANQKPTGREILPNENADDRFERYLHECAMEILWGRGLEGLTDPDAVVRYKIRNTPSHVGSVIGRYFPESEDTEDRERVGPDSKLLLGRDDLLLEAWGKMRMAVMDYIEVWLEETCEPDVLARRKKAIFQAGFDRAHGPCPTTEESK